MPALKSRNPKIDLASFLNPFVSGRPRAKSVAQAIVLHKLLSQERGQHSACCPWCSMPLRRQHSCAMAMPTPVQGGIVILLQIDHVVTLFLSKVFQWTISSLHYYLLTIY
uniref:Uncharacterized protein n=1 Tax=Sphaerodactylus townsendi TaxID=933632 RepID=A0ACB8F5P4_9SAUR